MSGPREVPEDSWRLWEAIDRGDLDATGAFVADEAEFEAAEVMALSGPWLGPEGFKHLWREWMESFDDFHVAVEELVSAGPDRGMAVIRQSARGRGSGVEVSGIYYYAGWWRDGKLVHGEFFTDRATAEQALSPGPT
jgi:ketosteroid isomerase-like protein